MPKSFVKDVDKGWAAFRKKAKDGNARVKIGVQGEDALKAKEGHDGKIELGLTVVQVATFHEFGVEGNGVNIPERSFLRATIDENRAQYKALIRAAVRDVLTGKLTQGRALGIIGTKVQADVIRRIDDGIAPANAPATIRAKGSSKPLIDTGQLKQSITYVVETGKKAKEKT